MNQAASHLANGEKLQGAIQNTRFLKAERGQVKEVKTQRKELFRARSPSFEERTRSVMQITSGMLIRKFQPDWFKIPFLGETETAVRLGIMFLVCLVELSTSNSILGLLFPF